MPNPEFMESADFYSPGPHISPEEFEEAVFAAEETLAAAANNEALQADAAAQLAKLQRKA